jgi:hypothetical protein
MMTWLGTVEYDLKFPVYLIKMLNHSIFNCSYKNTFQFKFFRKQTLFLENFFTNIYHEDSLHDTISDGI